jgi:F-type H+-transporting ATPase subunit epsilon
MQLDILTPEKKVYSGEADAVVLPGAQGKFEVLNRHAAMISTLKEGTVKVKNGNEKLEFKIRAGIAEVLNNKISVLTEGIID